MENIVLNSLYDGLTISVSYIVPKKPKAIIQFSHGMAEHKERYFKLIEYLAQNNYLCVIHDHRGHGASVREQQDLGDFYTGDYKGIVEDLHQVSSYFKDLYPELDLYLFAHSMGTLVARCYLQKYDNLVKKVILSGPPTKNNGAKLGLRIAKKQHKKKPNEASTLLNKLSFSKANSTSNIPNGWLCSNKKEVEKYNLDPLCGFVFKPSGFINLYSMLISAYEKKNYLVQNKDLKLFIIAGGSDPIINGFKKFNKLAQFMINLGYTNVDKKLYIKMRHEIINEGSHALVFQDILKFYES